MNGPPDVGQDAPPLALPALDVPGGGDGRAASPQTS